MLHERQTAHIQRKDTTHTRHTHTQDTHTHTKLKPRLKVGYRPASPNSILVELPSNSIIPNVDKTGFICVVIVEN